MITALFVPQDAPAKRVEIDPNSIDDIHELIGGFFDLFHFGGNPRHVAFVHDTGLIDGLPPNQLLTELFHEGLSAGYLAGDAVIAAFDGAGETVAPLEEVVDALEGLTIASDPALINEARERLRVALQWPEGVGLARSPIRMVIL